MEKRKATTFTLLPSAVQAGAKKAKKEKISLSRMIENFLNSKNKNNDNAGNQKTNQDVRVVAY